MKGHLIKKALINKVFCEAQARFRQGKAREGKYGER